jgi:DNA invertase Pin-like site-specific DNA recombinase
MPERQIKCAIYARVSTTDQNCDMQLRELREYCARRGWEITGEYVDTGWSGAKASRPRFDALMADARMRRFDGILVWKLDRWGRSVSNCLATIQELTTLGVRWMAITQNLDTDQNNPTARLILHILASVAEFEREMIRERVKAGMKAARHRGKALGRRRVVFDRAKVSAMRKKGASVREIARELGVGKGTIERALQASQNGPGSAVCKPHIQKRS